MGALGSVGKRTKGADFERELAKIFSLWWSWDERDDIFWRSQGSGGRATIRGARGRTTVGHYGDLSASDPSGELFTKLITCEFKCGYSSASIFDTADRPLRGACSVLQEWDKHLAQAINAHRAAGSYSWLIVSRRNNRPTWVYMPRHLTRGLRGVGAMAAVPRPYMQLHTEVRHAPNQPGVPIVIDGVTLAYFFANVRPKHIHKLTTQLGR